MWQKTLKNEFGGPKSVRDRDMVIFRPGFFIFSSLYMVIAGPGLRFSTMKVPRRPGIE